MPQFTPTQKMIDAAEAVFLAMAVEQTIKPKVESYQRAILAEGQWRTSPEYVEKGAQDQVILDPELIYLMRDEDLALYVARTHEARDKAGLVVDRPDKCPLLVAQSDLMECRFALIDAMSSITRLSADKARGMSPIKVNECVELTLRLLAPFVRPQLGNK